ncbi:hypothetical protein QE152_g30600 [Popillia japonica]|uniref:Uncharacterized protein n=1 Tax=Popillia japonica TaxID=7064 RepID=A0AAW1JE33_POPJA
MFIPLRANYILLTLLILMCTRSIQSGEVGEHQKSVPKLFGSRIATNYTQEVITTATRGITITVLDTNMQSGLRDSALKSLSHFTEIYFNEPEKILWYAAEEMNHKHRDRVWLGAVNYLYVIAVGPYISVDINRDRIFMFGVINC